MLTINHETDKFIDYDVDKLEPFDRIVVPKDIAVGEMLNGYYSTYNSVSSSKTGLIWKGDAIKTIKASDQYKSYHLKENRFYNGAAKQYCECHCKNPTYNHDGKQQLVGIDLEFPDCERPSSRELILLSNCTECNKDLTRAITLGSFHTTGEEDLLSLAKKEIHRLGFQFPTKNFAMKFRDLKKTWPVDLESIKSQVNKAPLMLRPLNCISMV